MLKTMQNVIFVFDELETQKINARFRTNRKIAYQYMNHIAIDEEAAFEIKLVLKLPYKEPKGNFFQRQGLVFFLNYRFQNKPL